MRVAVVGAGGQLGSDLVRLWSKERQWEVVALPHAAVDVTDFAAVRSALLKAEPEVVVNCAAYVRVDEAEDRVEEAFAVNAVGAWNVARAANETGALSVYLSTDYVFDGTKSGPYDETDPPQPLNVYGASKLAGEHLTRIGTSRWLVVRVASLFGSAGARSKGGNFLEKVLARARRGETLRLVSDVRMSPTYTADVARALGRWIERGAVGVVHGANHGSTTWFEFGKKALELAGLEARVEAISHRQYPSKAVRPLNSALCSARHDLTDPGLRPWQDALADYLRATGWLTAARAQRSASPARPSP